MNVGKAVYGILSGSSAVTDIVGTKIFPEIAEQEAAVPFVIYQLLSVQPEDTHDGPSKLDEVRIEFLCYHSSYNGAADLATVVRGALDRVRGTYNGVNVESVQFNDVDIEVEYDPRRYSQVLTFTFRIKRDNIEIALGTPVTGAQLGDLSDVNVAGVTDNQILSYDAATDTWVPAADAGGAEVLNELTDVQIIDPEQGDVLSYNSGVQKWMVNGGLQQLLAKFKASASGAQMFDTLNDTTKGYIDLLATSATMKVNVTGIEISEASPGVLTFSVAAGTEGNEVEFDAVVITGSSSLTTAADVVFKQGALTYFENSTGRIWLRVPNAGNLTVILPSSSGTLALTSQALPVGGTTGQALIKSSGTNYDVEWADITVDVQYHDRYQSDAASFRSGATATTEIYYSAIADGDGYAQSASTDTPTTGYDIRRKLYYSEAGFADPDTGTWTQFADIADNTTFANAKTALLAYLKARTGGTVPISLKMTWEEVAQAPSFTGLLNESYGSGAAAAYSVRRLNGNYTGAAIQVERSSDNTTQDIGFDANGDLDESALTTFCTGTTCKVRTWYDQSQTGGTGSGNDAVQTDHTKQPTIYTGGAIVKENGRVAVEFDGSDDNLAAASAVVTGAEFFCSNVLTMGTTGQPWGDQGTLGVRAYQASSTNLRVQYNTDNGSFQMTGDNSGSGQRLKTTRLISGTQEIFDNGILATSATNTFTSLASNNVLRFGMRYNNSTFFNGKSQEFVFYTSDKSTDRTSIEANIAGYFTQNTPLLDTYTGAAAAYSLRKLRTAYSGSAIRVRRASDNTEQDIGFNVFGELDTVSLASFCSGTNGFVKTWYDQASTNDATQTTTANQPKIYDSVTGVVTENGKPAVDFDGTNDRLDTPSETWSTAGDMTVFSVADNDGTSNGRVWDSSGSSPTIFSRYMGGNDGMVIYGASVLNLTASSVNVHRLGTYLKDGSTADVYVNGSSIANSTSAPNHDTGANIAAIGARANGEFYYDGRIQEIVHYVAAKTSDRTGIESNINTFYSIY